MEECNELYQKGDLKMNKRKIFEMLQDIECELFYLYADTPTNDKRYEDIREAHEHARKALISFRKVIKQSEGEIDLSIGDKVYQTDGIRIYESIITDIIRYTAANIGDIYQTCTADGKPNIDFDKRAIGTSIFLTREEAEKKLAEWGKK